jgi:hypothetical protein
MSTILPSSRMSTQVSFLCLYAYNVDWTDSGQGGKKSTTSLNSQIPLFVQTNARSSSTASGWKRRIQAVLEISQRGHLEEIQRATTSWFLGYKEDCCPANTSCDSTPTREESKGCLDTSASAGECKRIRGSGSIWVNNPICRPIMVSISTFPPGIICRQRALAHTLSSITHHISTSLMPPFVTKSGNGSTVKSSRTLPSGMRPRKCQILSTSRWAKEGILPVC